MATVRGGLIQMSLKGDTAMEPDQIRDLMLEAHLPLIDEAGRQGVQVLCFQEVFTQPYFCPSQDARWYAAAEPIPPDPPVINGRSAQAAPMALRSRSAIASTIA